MEKHFRVVLLLEYVFLVLHNIGCEEYCDSETFEANCSSSQVIVMGEARYGRPRLGRCITRDYGHVGCYADVLYVLDGICSGRRSCQLSVITLREFIQPCPKNLKSYMEASYFCVTVLDPTSVKCNDTTIDIRSGPPIYLQYVSDPDQMSSPSPSTTPNYTTSNLSDAGLTMPFCPLAFLTERGQRIDVTLYIFGSGKMPTGVSETYDHLRPCPSTVYVIDDGKQHIIKLCEARNRVQRIYTRAISQKSNRVVVYFGPSPGSSKDQMATQKFLGNYLIRVEVIGCIDFVPPPNSWRQIMKGGRMIIRCNFSMESWQPVCKGNIWMGGPTNCPEDTTIREEVCIAEPLKVFCRYGTVIFIRSAVFGRMRNNRCIDFDTTDLDCYGNVQPHLEGVCNSHEECTIGSHIDTLRNAYIGRCSKHVTLYLHVLYTCIPEIVREICVGEPYHAACPPGTVIFIRSAVFGRVLSSRCIDFDTTDLGCFVNVRPNLVGVCNGHRECTFGSHINTTRNGYFGECSNNMTRYLHVIYTCVHVIQCAKFIPPENMTVEDLATGYRLSCINDRNISWEVHCINNTWVSTPSESCDPSQAEDYDEGDSSFSEKVGIILPCVTAALIIFLAVVSVYIYMYKRRQRILINNEQDQTFSMLTESDE